jgi:hypothetical protein
VVEPVFGTSARRLGHRAKRLQQVLGDHLDRVALTAQLDGLLQARGATAADGFVLGRLHAELEQQLSAADDEQRYALRRVRKRKATSWLRST